MAQPKGDADGVIQLFEGGDAGDPVEEMRALANIQSRLFRRGPEQLHLGRYELVERIAAGGIGVVYRGRDPELRRDVAIKLVHAEGARSRSTTNAQARLVREAQAAARVEHANVISVYDVGTYDAEEIGLSLGDDGPPRGVFVVMELVEGRTLTDTLDDRRTELQEILELFAAAGRGLVAAHERGLCHRDFKPDNVVVARNGSVKVIDFGLAGALTEAVSPAKAGLDPSATGLLGTPAYMAPEQHLGAATDARTDQFSFCIALYEALFHRLPFDGSTYEELREACVAGGVPEPQAMPRAYRRVYRILLRGLSRDPARRFPSMARLLSELTGAAGARRRRLIAGGAVVMLCGAGLAAWMQVRVAGESRCTGADSKLAGVWDEARQSELRGALLATGVPFADDTSRLTAANLDAYATEWTALHRDACQSPPAELDAKMACLGGRLDELGALVDVLTSADEHVAVKATEAAANLPPIAPCSDPDLLASETPRPSEPATAAEVQRLRGELARARAQRAAGRFDEALAIASATRVASDLLAFAPLVSEACYLEARLQYRDGRFDRGDRLMTRALYTAEGVKHDRIAAQAAMHLVFTVGYRRSRYDEGIAWANHAEAAVRRLGVIGPQSEYLNTMGLLFDSHGDFERARAYFESALESYEAERGPDHPSVAIPANNLANMLVRAGHFDGAIALHLRALEIRRTSLGSGHPAVGHSLNNLGSSRFAKGQYEQALAHYRRALAIWGPALGDEHPNIGMVHANLGMVGVQLGHRDEAEREYRTSLRIRETSLGPDHPNVADSLQGLGKIAAGKGDLEVARALHRRALFIRERRLAPGHPEIGKSLRSLADAERQAGELDVARELYARALALWSAGVGEQHILVGHALAGLGQAELDAKDHVAAALLLERAARIFERHGGDPARLAAVQFALARARWPVAPGRARMLARQSLSAYRESERHAASEVAAIERWLAAR